MRITEAAVKKLRGVLDEEKKQGIKIVAVPGGCAGMMYEMGLADAIGQDNAFEADGITIFCDNATKKVLEDAVVDFDEAQDSFRIDNPKYAGCAGCGGCS